MASRFRGLLSVASSSRAPAASSGPASCRASYSSRAWEDSVEEDGGASAAKRLTRAILDHKICKLAPAWLPFVPGSCYWVPPQKLLPNEVLEFVWDLGDDELQLFLARVRPEEEGPPLVENIDDANVIY